MTALAAPALGFHPPLPGLAGGTRATPLRPATSITVQSEIEVVSSTPIRADSPYLEGHYPDYTVMPGVFVIDAAYDAVQALVAATRPGETVQLAEVRSVRFTTPLRPGDTLDLHCACTVQAGVLAATVTARNGPTPAATARLRFRLSGEHAPPSGRVEPASTASSTAPASVRSRGHDRVRALLPHRYPMLLVDRIVDLDPPDGIITVKAVSGSEPCYAGLAENLGPEAYDYPPALLMESWGQGAGVLWMERLAASGAGRNGVLILAECRGVTFHATVQPGDLLRHHVRVDHLAAGALFFSGESWRGDQPVATVRSAIAVMRPADTESAEAS